MTRALRSGVRTLLALLALGLAAVVLAPADARADAQPTEAAPLPDVDDGALFSLATASLREGRPSDAIAQLEALADRGVVDPSVSFDRGLAYVGRVRAGGEQPGDLGRAAHGFEEARELSGNQALTRDAAFALSLVRAEVARRRARAGEPIELDQGASLGRTIVRIVPEDAWAVVAGLASLALGLGLFVRRLSRTRRLRIGATITCTVAGPLVVLCAAATLSARDDRLHLREGVVVSAAARPSDARGIVLPNAASLPEGARVEVIDARLGWTRVRWGPLDAWVPSPAVREIAQID